MVLGDDMENTFEVINQTNEEIKEIESIFDIINFALKYLKLNNVIFNVILVDSETIRNINKEYRNKDSVTDVISFALEDDKVFIKTDYRVLGDIYICIERARSQALEYGHSFKREICFLVIHGLLHLLGYDHMTKEDEKVMFELQERILDEYGLKR